MATAGSIIVDLLARTGSFETDMDRAAKRVKATGKEIDSTAAALGRFAAAAGAAGLAFASMAAGMAMHSARSMDATAKMAEQIGTTTEALTGLRFAAQQFADVSDKTFDMALRRMTRRIEEAAAGSGGAKNALDALGLSAKQLAQMSPDQQFLALADAMKNTESQAQRLRHTMAIFDTEGMPLVAALQRGSEEMERHIEIARRFGLVLSTEAAQAASDFTDNIKALTDAASGIKQQVAEAVLPSLVAITDRLVEISQSVGPVGEKVETALKVAGVAAGGLAVILTGRLTAAVVGSAGSFALATVEAGRYQMALARMAGVSAAAATGIGAMTAATRAASGLMTILGGSVGLAATLGLTAAAFLAMGRDAKAASVDIDDLSESFKTLSAQKLELRLFDLEDEVKRLEDQARESGEILRTIESDALALADAQGVTAEEFENLRRSLLEQRDAHATNNAELDRARTLLNQVIDHLERMRGAAHGAAGGVNALNQAMHSEAGEKYLAQIQGRIKALQDAGDPIKIASRYIAEHTDLTEADRVAIMSAAHAEKALIAARDAAARSTKAGTSAINEAKRAAEAFRKEQERALVAQYQSISAIHAQAQGLEDQVALFGMSKTAIEDLTIARLEEQAAVLRGFDGSQETVRAIETEIEARKRLRNAIGSLEQREAERASWDAWARDVEQIFDRVGQSLTDAIFDGGKSGRDLLRDLFKGLTFNILINPVMNQMQGWVTNQLGGMFGYQNPQQQQQAGGGGFGFNGGTFGAGGVEMAGDWLLRSGIAPETGAKMLMNADAIAKVGGNILGYGKAIYDLTQGNYGTAAGTAIGQALGGPPGALVGSFIGGFVDDLFGDDKPTTRRSQQGASHMLPDGTFEVAQWDSRQSAASQEAARDFAQSAVKSADELFKRIGVDAQIYSFMTLMESSILGDKQGVGSSGKVRVGDEIIDIGLAVESSWTKHGVGGWSDAEMLPRLQADIQLTLLEAFQAAGDSLPDVLSSMLEGVDIRSLGAEEAQALAQTFGFVVEQVTGLQEAVERLPFAQLRDLSFDAAANLIQFAGSLEALDAGMTSYFQNFYSEAEQLDWLSSQISASLSELGLTMPDVAQGADAAKAAYRELVESLDLTTEEGQRAYATLMTLSGGFAELVTGLDQLAQSTGNAATRFDSLISSLMGMASDALSAVQQRGQEQIERLSASFARTDSVFNAYRSQVQQLESQWGSLISTMDRSMRDLRGRVEASSRLQYNQARSVISTALLTGQMPQTADLGEAIRTAQQGVTGGRYASAFDQQKAYLTLANELEALQGIAKPELDAAQASLEQLEKQYNRLRGIEDLSGLSLSQLEKQLGVALSAESMARTQIEQIERQIAMAQLQYQQLVGINEELSTLPGALNALANAVNAANAAREAAGKAESGVSRETRYLANNPDVLDAYLKGYGGNMSAEELARYHYDKYGRNEGRSFDVGTPYVPYDMTANIHRGEIIIDPRSSDILRRYGIGVQGGGNTQALERRVDELVAENRKMSAYLYQITKEAKRTALNTEDTATAIAHNPSDDVVVVF